MPPWTSRLLSPSSRNEPGSNAAGTNPVSPGRVRSRVTESDILDNAYGIPSLPPHPLANHEASTSVRPTRTPSHGRSMSHPFPSIFTGKKKRSGDSAPNAGFESTDEDGVSPELARNTAHNPTTKQKVPDKDLRTGKCMTCDSMVRWPKDLKVFRCTVCLTINDLKPIALEARRGDGHRVPVPMETGTYPVLSSPIRVPPLSIDKTRQLVDQCITTYLLNRLKHDEGSPSSPLPSQPRSPALRPQVSGQMEELSDTLYTEDPNLIKLPTPPIHLSGRPINHRGQSSGSRQEFPFNYEFNLPNSAPYSRSSPGNFFDTHMEQRGRDAQPGRSMARGKSRTENQASTEIDGEDDAHMERMNAARNIFKPLEEYIITSFGSFECINASFSTVRPNMAPWTASEGARRMIPAPPEIRQSRPDRDEVPLSEMDAKTLLIGDFAENGSWWTGELSDVKSPDRSRTYHGEVSRDGMDSVTLKSPRIDWAEANEWYHLVVNAGRSWRRRLDSFTTSELHITRSRLSDQDLSGIEEQVMEAQARAQRVLLKATEILLKRPGRPLNNPSDLRFILIILANPLLYPSHLVSKIKERSKSRSRSRERKINFQQVNPDPTKRILQPAYAAPSNPSKGSSGQHSGIIKRILGLMSNLPNECHHHLVSWLARYSGGQFQRTADLIGSFVTYRLTRQHGKKREIDHDPTAGLIPSMTGSGRSTSAALHAALGASGPSQSSKKNNKKPQPVIYNDDWQIKAAARVMSLVFSANNSGLAKRLDARPFAGLETGHSAGLAARERAHRHGQILATSDFYNTLLDYSDLIADFEAWESRRGKFAFCQYPFFLSIWAKIQIMEHDARRQMEFKAREAFFDSIMTRKTVNQYLVLRIRRDCLVEDSLKGVSEVVGTGGEEIKKGLRIEFKGEEGIDAGGLRKEWFLLLVRDVFNPEHGMFTYDEDSQFCYFNPNSFETTDQFFLVGVVMGLAIYNSTILDVAFPPFVFRKLLAAAPATTAVGATQHTKPSMTYSLEDLAEFRPALANGLRQLLDFDGDVEATFCRDFVADVERYGDVTQIPLCANGEKRAVTKSNRREFVDLYVWYLLDTAVARQFEPFKRGFFTVCGGNALSLFRPEEIELLIRGSEEPLDIASLRAVSTCENWGVPNPKDTEPTVHWFWQSFQAASTKDQRKLLSFITGSDRIPAMGATNLVIRLSCLGEDSPRFPVARTCFNQLSLWRYSTKEKLENILWRSVHESEGFGLK